MLEAGSWEPGAVLKVLIADKFEQSGIDGLKRAGCDVAYEPDLKEDALTLAIASSGASAGENPTLRNMSRRKRPASCQNHRHKDGPITRHKMWRDPWIGFLFNHLHAGRWL